MRTLPRPPRPALAAWLPRRWRGVGRRARSPTLLDTPPRSRDRRRRTLRPRHGASWWPSGLSLGAARGRCAALRPSRAGPSPDPGPWPDVLVQVPVYNEPPAVVARALGAVAAQRYPGRVGVQLPRRLDRRRAPRASARRSRRRGGPSRTSAATRATASRRAPWPPASASRRPARRRLRRRLLAAARLSPPHRARAPRRRRPGVRPGAVDASQRRPTLLGRVQAAAARPALRRRAGRARPGRGGRWRSTGRPASGAARRSRPRAAGAATRSPRTSTSRSARTSRAGARACSTTSRHRPTSRPRSTPWRVAAAPLAQGRRRGARASCRAASPLGAAAGRARVAVQLPTPVAGSAGPAGGGGAPPAPGLGARDRRGPGHRSSRLSTRATLALAGVLVAHVVAQRALYPARGPGASRPCRSCSRRPSRSSGPRRSPSPRLGRTPLAVRADAEGTARPRRARAGGWPGGLALAAYGAAGPFALWRRRGRGRPLEVQAAFVGRSGRSACRERARRGRPGGGLAPVAPARPRRPPRAIEPARGRSRSGDDGVPRPTDPPVLTAHPRAHVHVRGPPPEPAVQRGARPTAAGAVVGAARRAEAPMYAAAHVLLAAALDAAGRPADALDVWHRAAFLVPSSPLVQRERRRLSGAPEPAPSAAPSAPAAAPDDTLREATPGRPPPDPTHWPQSPTPRPSRTRRRATRQHRRRTPCPRHRAPRRTTRHGSGGRRPGAAARRGAVSPGRPESDVPDPHGPIPEAHRAIPRARTSRRRTSFQHPRRDRRRNAPSA